MTTTTTTTTMTNSSLPLLKAFLLLLLLLPFSFLLIFLLHSTTNHTSLSATSSTSFTGLQIRPGYRTYDEYISRQLKKTQDPSLRRLWLTRDWDRKVRVFAGFFRNLQSEGLLSNASRALCVGARVGQEVAAIRLVGVLDSVGIDLVPHPPLVVEGDFHSQPFGDGSFDFEFSNVFDHALYPDRFVGEIERTLRPGGVAVLQVALRRKGDKYSANDLYSVDALVGLFRKSELVRVRKVDGFGLDTEVVLRKKKQVEVQRRSNKGRSS